MISPIVFARASRSRTRSTLASLGGDARVEVDQALGDVLGLHLAGLSSVPSLASVSRVDGEPVGRHPQDQRRLGAVVVDACAWSALTHAAGPVRGRDRAVGGRLVHSVTLTVTLPV